jgi:hypothetical protein
VAAGELHRRWPVSRPHPRKDRRAVTDDQTDGDLLTLQATIKDLVADFLYYDRKEDDTMPVGRIEELIDANAVTPELLTEWFAVELRTGLRAS